MNDTTTTVLRAWGADQVGRYAEAYPRYQRYAEVLGLVPRRAADGLAPLAIVHARPKSIPSFAEKALRKRATRPDPVTMFTDLCGRAAGWARTQTATSTARSTTATLR